MGVCCSKTAESYPAIRLKEAPTVLEVDPTHVNVAVVSEPAVAAQSKSDDWNLAVKPRPVPRPVIKPGDFLEVCNTHGLICVSRKCKFCCSGATYACSTTNFYCEECHKKPSNPDNICRPESCLWKQKHPAVLPEPGKWLCEQCIL